MYRATSIEFHRNGVGGEPFTVVSFSDLGGELRGIIFDSDEPFGGVAIIRPDDPQAKFRGDYFARALRELVADYESHLERLWREDDSWDEGHAEAALKACGRLTEGSGSVNYQPKVSASTTANGGG